MLSAAPDDTAVTGTDAEPPAAPTVAEPPLAQQDVAGLEVSESELAAVAEPPPLTAAPLQRAEAELLAARLRVVAEPTRLMLLSMIHAAPGGEASAGDLAAPIGLTGPTVSYHLRALTEAGLVTRDRRGTWIFYSLVPGALQRIKDLLG
ncbi:ArsR/SmtB family transcription factor [Dactylosporangium sp. CA-139066]|uniref:ArsR/SmtB family transcription factor n=1 Tax=Dactylosporangium sp. CA-139066 TaxID=3239930 RepID=UPI003D8BAABF